MDGKLWRRSEWFILAGLILLQGFLFFSIFPVLDMVLAANQTETIITELNIGNVAPDILNVSINRGNTIDLIANSTYPVGCIGVVRDYNGDGDLNYSEGRLFDNSASAYTSSPDNNNHYRTICVWDLSYDDAYHALINCTFNVTYYANNATWNCTINVTDNQSKMGFSSNTSVINRLLALDVPDRINYGTVNATEVSLENRSRLFNYGNVHFNISLYGYALNDWDNLSMNCSLGYIKNISIEHEKYNLTGTTAGVLTLSGTGDYTNLSSNTTYYKKINLMQRQNDAVDNAYNDTYWRIYVPLGVAGTCRGNVVFSAIASPGIE